jgi:hypothetical protein
MRILRRLVLMPIIYQNGGFCELCKHGNLKHLPTLISPLGIFYKMETRNHIKLTGFSFLHLDFGVLKYLDYVSTVNGDIDELV